MLIKRQVSIDEPDPPHECPGGCGRIVISYISAPHILYCSDTCKAKVQRERARLKRLAKSSKPRVQVGPRKKKRRVSDEENRLRTLYGKGK